MSWKSPKTLAATLETYAERNLFSYFDEVLVLFQEISDRDKEIATKYNLKYISTNSNIGIYGGMRLLAESVRSDYVLMLENDCILIEPEDTVKIQLEIAATRLTQNQVDVYRMRHRWQPGEKFDTIEKYKRYHPDIDEGFNFKKFLRKTLRPNKYKKLIGTAPYVHDDPKGYLYDQYIQKQPEGDFIIDSACLPWTNQSVICSRKWLIETILYYVEIHPSRRTVRGFQDVEKSLNCKWWQEQHFKIGLGLGLFSHKRLDELP
jgi:hypothetical protein